MKQMDESVLATYPIAFKINEALKVRERIKEFRSDKKDNEK